MDEDDGFGELAHGRFLSQQISQQMGIHVPRFSLTIHKDGCGPAIQNGVDAGTKGKGGDNHFVAYADAKMEEDEVEGGRARAEGEGVGSGRVGANFPLKGIHLRAEGGYPIAGKGFLHELLLVARHVGGGEVDAGMGHGGVRSEN